ncbi:MAG: hypothetical protein AB1797_02820 [bacterium]
MANLLVTAIDQNRKEVRSNERGSERNHRVRHSEAGFYLAQPQGSTPGGQFPVLSLAEDYLRYRNTAHEMERARLAGEEQGFRLNREEINEGGEGYPEERENPGTREMLERDINTLQEEIVGSKRSSLPITRQMLHQRSLSELKGGDTSTTTTSFRREMRESERGRSEDRVSTAGEERGGNVVDTLINRGQGR